MARSGSVCGKPRRRYHHFHIFSRRIGRDSYSVKIFLATKILHLIEAFCQPTFLFAQQQNHHLIFFLLETVNNLVQVNLNNPPKYKKIPFFSINSMVMLHLFTVLFDDEKYFTNWQLFLQTKTLLIASVVKEEPEKVIKPGKIRYNTM